VVVAVALALVVGAGCPGGPGEPSAGSPDAAAESRDAGHVARDAGHVARDAGHVARDAGHVVADAGWPGDACHGRATPGVLPERVLFRTASATFNRRWMVALQEGRIWVKPNPDSGEAPGAWRLLGPQGLPWGSGITRFPAPTEVVEISADGVHLQALSGQGVFYRGTDLTGDVQQSFTWTDKWGHPGGEGGGLQQEFTTARGWSVSDAHPLGVARYEDRLGTSHSVGLGVAHLYRLGPLGNTLFFNDWWLPNDWSRQVCMPERGTLQAQNTSTSASTTMVMGPRGEIFTRLYDYDTGGENDLLTYSYVITGPSGTTRALPAEDWKREPDIPGGRVTRTISIHQDGQGNAARVLRVEGVQDGVTGYFTKRITDAQWTFQPTGHLVCGPYLDASSPAPEPLPAADARLVGTLSREGTSVGLEFLDFNVVCSPARARLAVGGSVVTAGGQPLELLFHHVHGHTTDRRATSYWTQGVPARIRGALLLPRDLDAIDDEAARAALKGLLGTKTVINVQGQALPGSVDL
jgi:hypothetical protein